MLLLLICYKCQQREKPISHNCSCCHTERDIARQTCHLTQSQYFNTGPTSPSTDPITQGAWQGSHWSVSFYVTGMTRPRKISVQAGFEPGIFRSRGGHTKRKTADQTFHLTQPQYRNTGPTSPSADPVTPGAWQGSHWSANV